MNIIYLALSVRRLAFAVQDRYPDIGMDISLTDTRIFLERLALIGLGCAAGFSLDEIALMFAPYGRSIDRKILLAKFQELDRTIRKLESLPDGLRYTAAGPAPTHAAASGVTGPQRKRTGPTQPEMQEIRELSDAAARYRGIPGRIRAAIAPDLLIGGFAVLTRHVHSAA